MTEQINPSVETSPYSAPEFFTTTELRRMGVFETPPEEALTEPGTLKGEEFYLGLEEVYRKVVSPDGAVSYEFDPYATLDAAQEKLRKTLRPLEGDDWKFVVNE